MNFPITYLLMYIAYYSGQAVYNTYLNLYLTEIGMSATQIGILISFSTVGVLLSQLFWGESVTGRGKSCGCCRFYMPVRQYLP